MSDASPPPRPADRPEGWRERLRLLGPGIAIAATGVGAGDLVAASVSGARFGYALVWAAALGAALKYVLNEGLARWQLATGTTLIEGWVRHLGRWVQYVFLVYLVIWSLVVGAALVSACGLAAHAIAPGLSVNLWPVVHSLVGVVLVLVGGYRVFESLVKVFIGVMFVTILGCALAVAPPAASAARAVTGAGIPAGSVPFLLGMIGGVGGSVTMLAYGYWIRERGWRGPERLGTVRWDLGVAYALTGLFGVGVVVLAAATLHGGGVAVEGNGAVLTLSAMLDDVLGRAGRWTFLVGFWGAVATSLLGVWQGVPYLFCDFVGEMKRIPAERREAWLSTRSPWYRAFLLWLSLPTLLFLLVERPVAIIVAYAVLGALFMPFLAATLLYLNARRDLVGALRTSWPGTIALLLCLALFAYLAVTRLQSTL